MVYLSSVKAPAPRCLTQKCSRGGRGWGGQDPREGIRVKTHHCQGSGCRGAGDTLIIITILHPPTIAQAKSGPHRRPAHVHRAVPSPAYCTAPERTHVAQGATQRTATAPQRHRWTSLMLRPKTYMPPGAPTTGPLGSTNTGGHRPLVYAQTGKGSVRALPAATAICGGTSVGPSRA